jgi:NAD(P)-dependent dehydrogenase (short-subunit alcohol dehydrogenase family)
VDAAAGEALARRFPALRFVPCDVRREADIERAVRSAEDAFGRLDILFNNAGAGGTPASLERMDAAAWDDAFALLVRAAMLGMKYALPSLKRSGSGAVVNTASVAGLRVGASPPAYSAAKAALNHLTRLAAAEFAPFGVRVNAICPGVIMTPSVGNAFGASREEAERLVPRLSELAQDLQPLRRAGTARDIAEACLYLCSEASGFVTGTELVVDGGLLVSPPEGFSAAVLRIADACAKGS